MNWSVQESSSSRKFEKFLVIGTAGLDSTGYRATKNKFLTKFNKVILKILKNFKKYLHNGAPF